MLRFPRLGRRGATAAEFAIILPVITLLMFGIIQAGVMFVANAGLQHAIGQAARASTLWPRRSNEQIIAEFNNQIFGVDRGRLPVPQITRGTANGVDYTEITATYSVPLKIVGLELPPIVLRETRRAYMP